MKLPRIISGYEHDVSWQPWGELMTKTLGFNPEICKCGAKMIVQKCVTDAEGIATMMAKLKLSVTPPPLGRAKALGRELSYPFKE